MSSFKEDRLENEKSDPLEKSNLKFVNVPISLVMLFLGFGISYLALETDRFAMDGDSRTPEKQETAAVQASGGTDIATLMEQGKQIYVTTCQACHQANGNGLAGAFPPLGGSDWVSGSPKRLAAIILHGVQGEITVKNEKYQSVMPPFKQQLTSENIAAVATYVRKSFGNDAEPVTVEMVEIVKKQTESRQMSWNGEAELNSQNWD